MESKHHHICAGVYNSEISVIIVLLLIVSVKVLHNSFKVIQICIHITITITFSTPVIVPCSMPWEEVVIEELEECTDMWLVPVGDKHFFVLWKVCSIINVGLSALQFEILVRGQKKPCLHRFSIIQYNTIIMQKPTKIAENVIDPSVSH